MNYQHRWGQTEEAMRARRDTVSRRRPVVHVSPLSARCPICGRHETPGAIEAGACLGCHARVAPAVKAEMPGVSSVTRTEEVRRRVRAELAERS